MESERRFQHVMEACGVNKSLRKLGVKEGDTVFVAEVHSTFMLNFLVKWNFVSFILLAQPQLPIVHKQSCTILKYEKKL